MLLGIYLGGIENRCKNYLTCFTPFCRSECVQMSLLPQTPYSLHIDNAKSANVAKDWHSRELPFCPNGNHPGRWLVVPSSLTMWCNNSGHGNQRISEQEWRDILHREAELHADSSSISYFKEVQSYLNGNICSMFAVDVDTSDEDLKLESRHAMFAPFTCKYKLYWPEEAMTCLRERVSPLLLTGDSLTRNLYVTILNKLRVSTLSSAEAKKKTNVKKERAFNSERNNVSVGFLMQNPWQGTDVHRLISSGKVERAKVVVSDFGFLHNQRASIRSFEFALRSSILYTFWQNISLVSRMSKKMILQKPGYFQSLMTGMKTAELAHRLGVVIEQIARGELGFTHVLDAKLFGAAQLELRDGLHLYGLNQMTEFMILMNLLCN